MRPERDPLPAEGLAPHRIETVGATQSAISGLVPTEPLHAWQWHLAMIGRLGETNFVGLERIWADHRGAGLRVGIWDDKAAGRTG